MALVTALLIIRVLPAGISFIVRGCVLRWRGRRRGAASAHGSRMIFGRGKLFLVLHGVAHRWSSWPIPAVASPFSATNTAYYLLNIPMGSGLQLGPADGGVLSFGQVAFFLRGDTYTASLPAI